MGKIGKVFEPLDIYGQNYTFKHEKNEKYSTTLGGMLSIISIAIIALTTITFLSGYIDTSKPEISLSTKIEERPPKRDLYKLKFTFAVGMFLEPSDLIPVSEVEKYITPLGFVLELNTEEVANAQIKFNSVELIKFKPCTDLEDKTLSNLLINAEDPQIKAFAGKYLMCPEITKPEEFFVLSNPFSPPHRIIRMAMFPCTLENPSECADASTLTRVNLNFGFVQTSFVPSKKGDPLKQVPVVKDFRIGVTQETKWTITLMGNEIYDDDQDFYERRKTFSFFSTDEEMMYAINRPGAQTHCTMEQITNNECLPYTALTIKSSGKTGMIVRSYAKALGTLGEIGGTAQLIVVFFGFIYLFYNAYFMRAFKRKTVLSSDLDDYKMLFEARSVEDKEKLDEIADKIVSQREDIVNLYGNQTSWEVFQNAVMKDYHKTLIPVLMMNLQRKEKSVIHNKYDRQETRHDEKMVNRVQNAYRNLKHSKPKNEIQIALKKYFLKHIPESVKEKEESVLNFKKKGEDVLLPVDFRGDGDEKEDYEREGVDGTWGELGSKKSRIVSKKFILKKEI